MYSISTRSTFGIARRLYLGFAVIVAILLILVSVSYSSFSKLNQANEWNTHTFRVLAGSADMTESLVNMETGERGFALTGAEASLEPYIAGKETFQKSLKSVVALTADNAQQQLRLNALKEMESQWRSAAADPAIALRRTANDNPAAMEAVIRFEQTAKGKALMDKMRSTLGEMVQAEQVLLVARSTTAKELHSATNATLIGGGALATVLSIVLAVVLTRMVLTPLRAILNATEDLRSGDGDLTYRLPELPAEFGQVAISLNGFIERLHSIITDVRKGTQSIATASEEIAAGNLDLSSRTEQQASSLEETASSMEELTSTVQQNADNARQATGLATSATTVALRGSGVVAEVVSTMSAISDSARQIADIIGVIDGIAFQTNILALNAAVEAARAGEQGRGFAVVASEVRNLAHRSATAAKEIKTLITDSVNRVETGSRLVGDAGETMEEIVVSVRRVTDIMTEISAASSEQEAGIMQINQAINEMDNVTQQNAALVEEAAAASQSLQEQALRLEAVVGVFKLDVAHGGANATASRQALARQNAGTMRLAAP